VPTRATTTRAWLRTLDIGALPAGRYRMEVGVGRAGELAVVVGTRRFTTGL
jgi:hypothetical protein